MLTPILKTRTLAGFVLAYLICAGLMLFAFYTTQPGATANELLFSHWAFSWIQGFEFILPALGLGLLTLGAITSRYRPGETKLAFGTSNLTMIVLIAIALVQADSIFFRPDAVVCLTISIAAFLLVDSTYKQDSVLSQLFHVGLLLGLSSMFVGQAILLLLPVGVALLILRTGNWKEWTVLLLGYVMCAIFIMLIAVWHDTPLLEFKRIIQSAWSSGFGQPNVNAGHAVLIVALIAAIAGYFQSTTLGTVTERNLTLTNVFWVIGVILMVILLGLEWQQGILLASFPLSVSTAKTIERIERWWLADLLLLVILSAPLVKNLWLS